ncbi:hypothetical protein GCM10007216_07180 [Thalassobacillus devorans]|uniref:N-acetylmuramoyl-L-alanine amidase n=1 Tax=Thalassobacillus devorans TaxID=279813 RepID=A0ABQ1NPA5_9BACI|nr:N-acetylmuramoyl-L-alanine amidase [Thalassobacillus devorans]NIK27629.1 N-acetylmuramoyl-L-alanine amidase CwlA [Thalassobacillus devorans]GGC79257.1 hypothetical protein GCM10007216_07180 [Thalassobacillus devorans]
MQLEIQSMLLPKHHPCRPGHHMKPLYITVHTTGNRSRGANAMMHGNYLRNLDGSRLVSWHYTVDEKVVIKHLPDNESGWHAGDGNGPGNRSSIGIEICEHEDGDFEQAVGMAAQLIRLLQDKHNLPVSHVVPHQKWSGKICPRPLLPEWNAFLMKLQDTPAGPFYMGKKLVSIYDGMLRFYIRPSWKDSDVYGHVNSGYGFPVITNKLKVGKGFQYEVRNSNGKVFYITASEQYVRLVNV